MGRFLPIQEVINLPMLGNHDYLKRAKGRLLTWSKMVWEDMELSCVKTARREVFEINKRTNTVDMPNYFRQLCSVNVIDKCGVIHPVYRDYNVKHSDLVDIQADKDCACEFKCNYKLCNTIKGYEAVTTVKCDKMPDGSDVSFTCVDRKAIDTNGFFYEETQYPLRQYVSGVWIDTIKYTENRKLCKVEVDANGCVCDTETNVDACCHACGFNDGNIPVGGTAETPPSPQDDTWIYYCNSKMDWFSVQCGCYPRGFNQNCNNFYNISELGDRLIFPHNFGYDKVLVRFYADVNLNDLQIPRIAVDTFIAGLKWFDVKYDDTKQNLEPKFGRTYALMKFGLLRELNKYRIEELAQIVSPKAFVPSYIFHRSGYWYNDSY